MALQLVLDSGPLEGKRLSLKRDWMIGRTKQGLDLMDPLVSKNHARIEVKKGRITITDLGSKTGTLVNGESISPNRPYELVEGDRIRIGETSGSITSPGMGGLFWLMTPAWALVLVAIGATFWLSRPAPLVLVFAESVRAPESTTSLEVPLIFARTHGISLDRVSLLDVRDDDLDGVDEIWLGKGGREMVITFDPHAAWRVQATVPPGCTARTSATAPQLDCDGTIYHRFDGQYIPVEQEGVVVWMRGKATGVVPPDPELVELAKQRKQKPPQPLVFGPAQHLVRSSSVVPFRMPLRDQDQIAGFLSTRDVHESVQYILCEDQGFGLPAQVRTSDDEVRELVGGCSDALQLIDTEKAAAFDGARIVAVSFTATGTRQLAMDITRTLTGTSDDLLANAALRRDLAEWRRAPVAARALGLTSDALVQGFKVAGPERLQATSVVLNADEPAKPAVGGALLNRGVAELAAGVCRYRVRTNAFRCALVRGCLPGAVFSEVVEKGCGPDKVVLSVGYANGIQTARTEHAVIQLEVESDSVGPRIQEVVRARIGIRSL